MRISVIHSGVGHILNRSAENYRVGSRARLRALMCAPFEYWFGINKQRKSSSRCREPASTDRLAAGGSRRSPITTSPPQPTPTTANPIGPNAHDGELDWKHDVKRNFAGQGQIYLAQTERCSLSPHGVGQRRTAIAINRICPGRASGALSAPIAQAHSPWTRAARTRI